MALPKNKKLPKKPNSQLTNPGKNPNKGGKGGKGLPKYYGGLGGYKGVRTRGVRRLVNGVLRDELNDIRKERRMVRRESRNARNAANRDYQRGLGDLEHIFGESSGYLNHLSGQNQQMFQGQQGQAQAATQALQQSLGGTYSGAQNDAMGELQRLGIQGGGNFNQLIADQANSQAMAQQGGANTQSTLGLQAGNSAQFMNLLQGMNQGSQMSHVGRILNERNDALGEIRQGKADNFNKIREAMSDARGSRRDLFFQLLQQLQQTGWEQYMQNQSLKRNR